MTGIDELYTQEEITQEDVWEADEISQIRPILPMEVTTEVPEMDTAVICGDPIRLGDELDFQQGFDNPYGAFGTCGLNAIANICHIGGVEVSEPEVVAYAMENDLCTSNAEDPTFHGGGTTIGQQLKILENYGFPSHCEFSDVAGYERLAEAIEGGHGVLVGLNSGELQDRPWKIYNDAGEITANHAVCMTGTVRAPESGELVGFYLCDSSSASPDGGRTFVTLEEMNDCYAEASGSYAVITDQPIRGVEAEMKESIYDGIGHTGDKKPLPGHPVYDLAGWQREHGYL